MSNDDTTPGDRPIIIQGGGSISLDVPERFEEEGTGKKGGRYRNGAQDLLSVTVDGRPVELRKNSRIEIRYGTRTD